MAPFKRVNLQYTHMMICESTKRKIIYKVFKGLGIIYFATYWVILVSVNNKSIHQSKQKSII